MGQGRELRCFDYVNHPYERVRDTLGEGALELFGNATTSAATRARSFASTLRVNVGGVEIGTDIAITVNKVEEEPARVSSSPVTRMHLEWQAQKKAHLFPLMKAELAIYPLTATETQLELTGNYQPPLGPLGSAIDAVVGHRIADASVHRFVSDVARYLRESLADG